MAKMVNTYLWTKAEGGVPTQDFDALKTKVDNLANTAAKTNISNTFTANQQLNGQLKIAKAAESLIIDSSGDKFIAFKNGNTREAYVGRPTSGSRDFEINTGTGNLKITTANNISANNNIELSAGKSFKGLSITLGFGGTPVIAPDEGTTKPLRFSNGNIRFGSLDLQNQTKLANVPNIKNITSSANIGVNQTTTINLPANSIVLMVRTGDLGLCHTNWKLTNAGVLTITNSTGGARQFLITYWEV